MRKVLLDLTISLDGFIADPEGGIDWILPPPEEIPADYLALMETVDALVMGRASYEMSLGLAGGLDVFEGKRAYVITSHRDLQPHEGVEFVHETPESFVAGLRKEPGGTIWVFGGGRIATALSAAGLIDDYLIVVQPILLGEGIPLWRESRPRKLELVHTRRWPDGLVELRYRPASE